MSMLGILTWNLAALTFPMSSVPWKTLVVAVQARRAKRQAEARQAQKAMALGEHQK